MKGIVFNLLESVVQDRYGEETWESLLETTGLEGAYTAVGSYPDEELAELVKAGSSALNIPEDELVRWFGRACMPLLAERYPSFFEPHTKTRDFLMTLNEVIHPEVRKLFPGAYAPSFEFDASEGKDLSLSYHSHRGLCAFAEGLIDGAAEHYGEKVSIQQPSCTKRGDEKCVIITTFA